MDVNQLKALKAQIGLLIEVGVPNAEYKECPECKGGMVAPSDIKFYVCWHCGYGMDKAVPE